MELTPRTSEWRGRICSDGLNTHPEHQGRCIPIGDFAQYGHDGVQAVVGPADVIVVQRNLLSKAVWDACDYWRGLGKLVLADLDDDYPHLTPQNPAYHFWILDKAGIEEQTGLKPVEALTEGFRHVDALISPNELILSDWAEVLPDLRGYWQPNYARWGWYKDIEQKPVPQGDEPIILGWGGSVSHYDSWWFSGMREAVPELTAKYPRVMWKICGGDKRIKKFFEDHAPGRWTDQAGVPPDQWPLQVASFDVGLAPLCGPRYPQGERYDLRRSWLKAVEYLLAGVPWIGSAGIVYEKLDGQGGFCVENTPEAWYEGVSRILDDLEGHKAASKKLMPWARDNLTMEHVVDQYVEVFQSIAADWNAKKKARLPNIAYAADIFDQVDEIQRVDVEVTDDGDLLERLAHFQSLTLEAVQYWVTQMDLDHDGIDIGRCVEYPLLAELNARVYTEVAGDGE